MPPARSHAEEKAQRVLARSAIGCLIAGVGLLNFADASWAHAVGVLCLFGFAVTAFLAVVFQVPSQESQEPREDHGREPTQSV